MMWPFFYGDGFGAGWMLFGWLMMVAWWVIIFGGVFLVIRAVMRSTNGGGRSALDILKERYAKGEITKKEFEEMKREVEK